MTDDARCERFRDDVIELAAGSLDGADRSDTLAHVTGCGDCQRLVRELSDVSDDVLLAVPEREPPPGFETRVLDKVARAAVPARRRRMLVAVAAAVAGAIVAAAATYLWLRDERSLAEHYRHTLTIARGDYFGARLIEDRRGGRVGSMFGYDGEPSWIFVTLDEGAESGRFRVTLTTSSGDDVDVGTAVLEAGSAGWGTIIPVPLEDVSAVVFMGEDVVYEGWSRSD